VNSGTWEFCEDADFQGRCITLSRDDRNLVPDGFNDRISSARPVADRGDQGRFDQGRDQGRGGGGYGRDNFGPPPPGGGYGRDNFNGRGDGAGDVILYQDVGFGGDSRSISGSVDDFRSIRFNDVVSSIRIRAGTWQFCSDAGFQGRCITLDRDAPSLVPMGFNDVISSMRRIR
jgi:Beta/Gamma crystallin